MTNREQIMPGEKEVAYRLFLDCFAKSKPGHTKREAELIQSAFSCGWDSASIAAIQQYKDSILAEVGEPVAHIAVDQGGVHLSVDKDKFHNWLPLYTSEAIIQAVQAAELTACKSLEQEIERLKDENEQLCDGITSCEPEENLRELAKWMDEVGELRQQLQVAQTELAAAQEEIAKWKTTAEQHKENYDILLGDLRMKLAASQAREQALREVVIELRKNLETISSCEFLDDDAQEAAESCLLFSKNALSQPSDTSNILSGLIEKAKAEEREACAEVCVSLGKPHELQSIAESVWTEASAERFAAAIRARGAK